MQSTSNTETDVARFGAGRSDFSHSESNCKCMDLLLDKKLYDYRAKLRTGNQRVMFEALEFASDFSASDCPKILVGIVICRIADEMH